MSDPVVPPSPSPDLPVTVRLADLQVLVQNYRTAVAYVAANDSRPDALLRVTDGWMVIDRIVIAMDQAAKASR